MVERGIENILNDLAGLHLEDEEIRAALGPSVIDLQEEWEYYTDE